MDTRGNKKENRKNRIKVWYSRGANPNPTTNICGCDRCFPRRYDNKINRGFNKENIRYINDIKFLIINRFSI